MLENPYKLLWKLYHINSMEYRPEKIIEIESTKEEYNHESIALLKNYILDYPVGKAITDRCSSRKMKQKPIDLKTLSKILLNSYRSKNSDTNNSCVKRTAPSAGALFPFDIYFNCNETIAEPQNFLPGLYYYCPETEKITMKRNNIYKLLFDHVIVDQDLVSNSMLQFFLVANFDKVIDKYGEIGYRFILIEAGHIAQNFNLVAVALDLACINIGGYIENYANKILGIDDIRSSVLYMFAIGAKDIVV